MAFFALIGLIAGAVIAVVLGRFIQSLSYRSSPSAPIVLAAACTVMVVLRSFTRGV